MPIKLIYSLFD